MLAERLHILLPREEELEKANTAVLAGLVDAQQHEVVREPVLSHLTVSDPSVVGERLDRVLGVVVVPGDPVVVEEREEPALVPKQPLLVALGKFGAG